MSARAAKPRILVADDDAVSLRFLASALTELGCVAVDTDSGGGALQACIETQFDLLLLDRRMPDCGGAALLYELRQRGIETTAIATSAELDASVRGELRSAGYVEALTKPIGLDALARALALHLPGWRDPRGQRHAPIDATPRNDADAASVLDDSIGLASVGGDRTTLQALRGLLARELETLRDRLAATSNPLDLADTLHRLRASCRYCGATALGEASLRLETVVRANEANSELQFRQFADACTRTLATLSSTPS